MIIFTQSQHSSAEPYNYRHAIKINQSILIHYTMILESNKLLEIPKVAIILEILETLSRVSFPDLP